MNTYHILNGDCLARQLERSDIQGEIITCRECLIDGNLNGDSLDQFWTTRAQAISTSYQGSKAQYFDKVVPEFEKIIHLPEDANIHLWFEDDLFCQTNMWFILSLLAKRKTAETIFRVFPRVKQPADHWKGFGISDSEILNQSLAHAVAFSRQDLMLGQALWTAYKEQDLHQLISLSHSPSPCFRHLEEVCQAQADRFPSDGSLGRPDKVVQELLDSTPGDFESIFSAFTKREGIYGFGDLQLKVLYDRLSDERDKKHKGSSRFDSLR